MSSSCVVLRVAVTHFAFPFCQWNVAILEDVAEKCGHVAVQHRLVPHQAEDTRVFAGCPFDRRAKMIAEHWSRLGGHNAVGLRVKSQRLRTIRTREVCLAKPDSSLFRRSFQKLTPNIGQWTAAILVETSSFRGMGACHYRSTSRCCAITCDYTPPLA